MSNEALLVKSGSFVDVGRGYSLKNHLIVYTYYLLERNPKPQLFTSKVMGKLINFLFQKTKIFSECKSWLIMLIL